MVAVDKRIKKRKGRPVALHAAAAAAPPAAASAKEASQPAVKKAKKTTETSSTPAKATAEKRAASSSKPAAKTVAPAAPVKPQQSARKIPPRKRAADFLSDNEEEEEEGEKEEQKAKKGAAPQKQAKKAAAAATSTTPTPVKKVKAANGAAVPAPAAKSAPKPAKPSKKVVQEAAEEDELDSDEEDESYVDAGASDDDSDSEEEPEEENEEDDSSDAADDASSDDADDQTAALISGFESSGDEDDGSDDGDAASAFKPGQAVPPIPDSKQVKRKLKKQKKERSASGEKEEPGVVYVGRIPHGFYEHEMRAYFSQFGEITRLRLSRNKRTGASKHFAFIEFGARSVAAIVAETMNNYLMFGHILKCRLVPPEQVHPALWKGANRRFKKTPWNDIERRRLEKPKSVEQWGKKLEVVEKRRARQAQKLRAIGYEFAMPQLTRPEEALERQRRQLKVGGVDAERDGLAVALLADEALDVHDVLEAVDGGDLALAALVGAAADEHLVVLADGHRADLKGREEGS
ncbi:hypothetical protein KEM52_005582 [Ascosphaera acerosa]|nr:hypothetical protein KEM52_005582 [Ascosphaera acerosa]